jgi:hypothetical protein
MAEELRFDSRQKQEMYLFSTAFRQALGLAEPAIMWVPGALSFLGVKRPGRETDHSPPCSVDAKNAGAIPPPPYVFMAQYLIS